MKNYVYLICMTAVTAAQALPLPWKNVACGNARAMTVQHQARTFEQQAAFLQSQCADNPGIFHMLVQEQIVQREQTLVESKQRQQQLVALYAQLNNDEDDSQDEISCDAIISLVAPDNSYFSHEMRADIQEQYQEAEDAWYPESATGVYEKASLAYVCAQAVGQANAARKQEIQQLKAMLN